MAKQSNIELEGIVLEELGNSMFRVDINTGSEVPPILCTISGKIRKNYIKIMAGDKVKLEVSPYDLTRGRITLRLPTGNPQQTVNNSINNNKKKKK